jgi:pyruvate dehydrogenase complex dehydrogenase (E1) component
LHGPRHLNFVATQPSASYEVAVIVRDRLRRMIGEKDARRLVL